MCKRAFCLFLEMEKRVRANGEQFLALIKFMESHSELAKPEPGPQGRLKADRLWQELTKTLNSVGSSDVRKTPDKWKKVWADWKSKTKKKALTIRQYESGAGGGPSTYLTLTALESRVMGIVDASAVEGHSEIEEKGFDRPSTAPSSSSPTSSVHLDITIGVEDETVPIPSPSPPPRVPSPVNVITIPSTSWQQHPAPRLPPTSCLPQTAPSPPSSGRFPRRHLRARRRLALTPLERVTSEFVRIEKRRLQLEEMRERNEARRIDVERERNLLLGRLVDIAQACFEQYLSSTIEFDTD